MSDDTMLDTWWNTAPKRRPLPKVQPIPVGAPTCTVTCAACGQRSEIAVDWAGRVCAKCRGDLPAAAYRIDTARERLAATEATLHGAWVAFQAEQDDATADLWTRIVQDRDLNAGRCERYATGKFFGGIDETERARRNAEAQAERQSLVEKRQRARSKYPAIAVLLDREADYRAELRALAAKRAALETARTEIAIAMGEEVPF